MDVDIEEPLQPFMVRPHFDVRVARLQLFPLPLATGGFRVWCFVFNV
jgi:hypothetical protein